MEALDPRLAYLTIEAASRQAEDAVSLGHNRQRLVQNHVTHGKTDDSSASAREKTPGTSYTESFLHLTLGHRPRDLLFGHVFGSDNGTCDILLDTTNQNGVSERAFSIDFNWTSGSLMLKALATKGIIYEEGPQRKKYLKQGESRSLNPKLPYTIKISSVWLYLKSVSRQPSEQRTFYQAFERYKGEVAIAVPSIPGLSLGNASEPTPNEDLLEGQLHHYHTVGKVGHGGYGCVQKAWDVKTGDVYAVKSLHSNGSPKSKDFWKEIQLLRSLPPHRCIVEFVDADKDYNFLVMEYLCRGTVYMHQQSPNPFTVRETEVLLHDMLEALSHLHSNGVVHRDIAPANILVGVREKNKLIVKLADFGLSRVASRLATPAGVVDYAAPETFVKDGSWTNKVDVWAVGMIALECLWGLPKRPSPLPPHDLLFAPSSPFARGWNHKIRDRVEMLVKAKINSSEPGPVLRVIVDEMLKENPDQRISANDALTKLRKRYDLGYFSSLGMDHADRCITTSCDKYEIHPSRFTFEDIWAEKPRSFVMRGPNLVHLRSLLQVTGVPTDTFQAATADLPKVQFENDDFIRPQDGVRLCQRLKLVECEKIILKQWHASPPLPRGHQLLIDLAEPCPISILKGCGLVNLNHVLEFAGESAAERDLLVWTASKDTKHRCWRIKRNGEDKLELYIKIETALSICQRSRELAALIQVLQDQNTQIPDKQDKYRRQLLESVDTKHGVIAVTENHRMVLVLKDRRVHLPSLEKAHTRQLLEVKDLRENHFVPLEDTRRLGIVSPADHAFLEEVGLEAKREVP